jgi:NADH:ubiquinone oxidoreductase subunit D
MLDTKLAVLQKLNGEAIWIDMTIKELEQVYSSLLECGPDEEDFGWGPTYEFAMQRRETALKILKQAIEELRIDD